MKLSLPSRYLFVHFKIFGLVSYADICMKVLRFVFLLSCKNILIVFSVLTHRSRQKSRIKFYRLCVPETQNNEISFFLSDKYQYSRVLEGTSSSNMQYFVKKRAEIFNKLMNAI